jgi:hypothetical protein
MGAIGSDLGDPTAEPAATVAAPAPVVTTRVKLLNLERYQGRFLAYEVDNPDNVYLLPEDVVAHTSGIQEVDSAAIAVADTPYKWDEELDALVTTKTKLRLALLFSGAIEKKPYHFRELVARLLLRGELPII